jgi:hypothetical protein
MTLLWNKHPVYFHQNLDSWHFINCECGYYCLISCIKNKHDLWCDCSLGFEVCFKDKKRVANIINRSRNKKFIIEQQNIINGIKAIYP